jgi:hypothetical protein
MSTENIDFHTGNKVINTWLLLYFTTDAKRHPMAEKYHLRPNFL